MDLIANKFRVLKTLGQGAMGEVYLVLPPHGDPVALKLLKTSETSNQKAAISQFENEFKVLKKLSHPHIGKIYDYGYDEDLKKVYFTSPWLKGCDLYVATKDQPYEKVEENLVQVLRAINYLHQKDLIHCDLKPGNVFVEEGQILLIDFGLAGYWGESIVGTPTYLAPEIFRGEHHSVASDLYALGVIFYNCLARTQPYSGKNLQEIYDRHRTHTPPSLSSLNPKVPKYMSEIAFNLLAKKPSERYQSAAAVIDEISTFSKKEYGVETRETLLSYLPSTSELIGRREAQLKIDNLVGAFLSQDEKKHYVALFIYGESGVGKSKFVNQIKNRLQLDKIQIEEARLPLAETDSRVLGSARAIILEDVDHYLAGSVKADTGDLNVIPGAVEGSQSLGEFLSLLEHKVLSPETTRFFLIVSGANRYQWDHFSGIFPQDDLEFESIEVLPFDEEETREFLETIIGQKQIPDKFVEEVFRNTGGNPGICQQIIENLIQQGLLFDESGRWSEDLLTHLGDILKKVETPRSLEEKLKLEYHSFSQREKEVVNWLAMAPQGLPSKVLGRLIETHKIGRLLQHMISKKIVREEQGGIYVLYRSAFVPFAQKELPHKDQQYRHDRLSWHEIDLERKQVWYHQSYGSDRALAKQALIHLGETLAEEGEREKALECYEQLHKNYRDANLALRVEWAVRAAENLIWLDRFGRASDLLSEVEQEVEKAGIKTIPINSLLLLWEKKGLSLLHQQRIKEAESYFAKGLKEASKQSETRVEEIRFLNDLAQIEMITGFPQKAITRFKKAREKARPLSRDEFLQITNNDLGHVYYRLKEYEKSVQFLEEDIKDFSRCSYREPLARAVYTLAEALRAQQKGNKAIREYERCIKICKKDNFLPLLLRAYNGLGNIHLVNEKFKDALDNYQKAIEISVHLKDLMTKAALLANQGLIYRIQSNWSQASRRFMLAKQILESKEKKLAYEHLLLSKCYSELAAIAREEKDSMKALSFQAERMRMVEESATLKSEEFGVKVELIELYIENRLNEPFEREIKSLGSMAKTKEEKAKVVALKERWQEIQNQKHDSTMEVDLEKEVQGEGNAK